MSYVDPGSGHLPQPFRQLFGIRLVARHLAAQDLVQGLSINQLHDQLKPDAITTEEAVVAVHHISVIGLLQGLGLHNQAIFSHPPKLA
ncbi:hypothetical protein EON65_55240 [archaeon]|nr:MAG: hypothetical protein EON65_55240 [archaeon]